MARDPGGVFWGGPVEFGAGGAAEGFDGGGDFGVELGETDVGGLSGGGRFVVVVVMVGFGVGVGDGIGLVAAGRGIVGCLEAGFPVVVIVTRSGGVVLIGGVALVGEDDAVLVEERDELGRQGDDSGFDA